MGVIVDDRLSFREHISYKGGKISKSLGILYNLKSFIPKAGLINLYYSIVYPHLIYCNLAWGGASAVHLNTLFVLQKRAIRIIHSMQYRDHTNGKFLESEILKLNDIHKYLLAVYMFTSDSSQYERTHPYLTRNRNMLNPMFNRLTQSQRSLFFSAPTVFNTLPDVVRNAPSIGSFKIKLKRFLLGSYLESV